MILKFVRNPSISQLTQWISNTLTKPITVHKKNAILQELWISEVILTCWNVETLLLSSISMFDWAINRTVFVLQSQAFPQILNFYTSSWTMLQSFQQGTMEHQSNFDLLGTAASDHDRLEVCYTICQTNLYKMCINSQS